QQSLIIFAYRNLLSGYKFYMKIIFDSNIFIADFNFKSSYFAILEDSLIFDTSITVIILSVVLEEVI
ncbi:hypothetical protein, partial [uncultured Nostoc sp.]